MNNIILGEKKYIGATTEDNYHKIQLESDFNKISEYDIKKVINLNDVFTSERQSSNMYQIYGSVDIMSILNGLKLDYLSTKDLFIQFNGYDLNNKNIRNSFKFYLLKPATTYYEFDNNRYRRDYEVIATPQEINIIDIGYSRNIFNENKYNIIINKTINLTDSFDGLSLPITDLYLYCEYQLGSNTNGVAEKLYRQEFNNDGTITRYVELRYNNYAIGDIIEGDAISFDINNFMINEENNINYRIQTNLIYNGTPRNFYWLYRPFLKINVNTFSDNISKASISGSSYEDIVKIPSFAKPLSENNTTYIWRNLNDKGYIDPLTGNGLSSPFVNGKHYIYENFLIKVTPDFSDTYTNDLFKNMKFGLESLGTNPNDNLDEFGQLCK